MAVRIEEAGVNIDAAISSVLSNLANIFSLKEHQRTALKDFVGGNDVFALLPTGVLSKHMQGFFIRPSLLRHLANGAIPD